MLRRTLKVYAFEVWAYQSRAISESMLGKVPSVRLAELATSMVDAEKLSFLNGYLYRVMVDMLRSDGADASGLYEFYRARIEQERSALSGYDRVLFNYMRTHFDPVERRVVHAGIGLGTLASALAVGGFSVCGLEEDRRRFGAATRLRTALADVWPAAAERYDLIGGSFPVVLSGTSWVAPETILVFTNCGSGWAQEFSNSVIASFPRFGDVILDARLFGIVRQLPEERAALIAKIEAQGLMATPIPETNPLGAYYHHIRRRRDDP